MDLTNKVAIVTGAGGGIGAAIARHLAAAGTRAVIVTDVKEDAAQEVAAGIEDEGGHAVAARADVTSRSDIRSLVALARKEYGGLDVFCSNAGVSFGSGIHAVDEQWSWSWQVNVMQHVYAAQAALPGMLRAGSGCLLMTASGAGLLSLPGDAPYAVTKHAAVGLGEWLAVTYRPRGIRVGIICSLGVRTPMLEGALEFGHPAATAVAAAAPVIEADDVAAAALRGIADESLFILPHPEVAELYARKAADPDAWLERTVAETKAAMEARHLPAVAG